MPTAGRSRWRWTAARNTCSPPSSPARSAAMRCRNWSRACSRSTTRWAPARSATASGVIQFFDPKRVVANPQLSLAGGAIKGWDKRNQFYFQMLESLAAHYGFSVDTPFERPAGGIPHSWCSTAPGGPRSISATSTSKGTRFDRSHTFEGIIPNLERRYRETDSQRRARGTGQVHQQHGLPELRRHPPARRGAACARRRQDAARNQPPAARRGAQLLQLPDSWPAPRRRSPRRSSRKSPRG